MEYVEGFVAAIPANTKDAYRNYALEAADVFKEYGAKRVVECWGDDIPHGKVSSFAHALRCEEDETVILSWIVWPSRETRDRGMEKYRTDPRINDPANPPPFDTRRMFVGGFEMMLDR